MHVNGCVSTIGRDTIVAVATAPGRGGIAVVRMSGPESWSACVALTGRSSLTPRSLTRVRLSDPRDASLIDRGLAVYFPAPASFTGEDVVELHVHGGRAVSGALIEALTSLPGLRPAEPGEFTRRAFENDKFDLTAAEAIADLVDAETAAQRRQALRQMDGELGALYGAWRGSLLNAMARLEATIDFSDEPIPVELECVVRQEVRGIVRDMEEHLADGRRGERLRDGIVVAIVGAPNVGKSSLLNRMARREAAIVAETAGTTRDVIEVRLDLGGYPVILADTAGLRTSENVVEQEGVRRARELAKSADLRLVVLDASAWPVVAGDMVEWIDGDALVVVNKIDLGLPDGELFVGGQIGIAVSARSGEGLDELLLVIEGRASQLCGAGGAPVLTRVRHRLALEEAVASLGRMCESSSPEIAAEELRLACRAIGRIMGRIDIEEMLDVIFREFCIGK